MTTAGLSSTMHSAAKGAQVDESSAGADRRPRGIACAFTVLPIVATLAAAVCLVLFAAHRAGVDHVVLTAFAVFVTAGATWCALVLWDVRRGDGLTLVFAPVVTGSTLLWDIRFVSGSTGRAATAVLGLLSVTDDAIAWGHRPHHVDAHHGGLPTAEL